MVVLKVRRMPASRKTVRGSSVLREKVPNVDIAFMLDRSINHLMEKSFSSKVSIYLTLLSSAKLLFYY